MVTLVTAYKSFVTNQSIGILMYELVFKKKRFYLFEKERSQAMGGAEGETDFPLN